MLQDHPLPRSPANDARHLHAAALQALHDREQHGRAHPATDAEGIPRGDQFRGAPERAGDIADRVPGIEGDEVAGALADGLDHQGDRAGLGVRIGDRQGDALGAGAEVHDHELPGKADLSDALGGHLEESDVWAELLAIDDGIHGCTGSCLRPSVLAAGENCDQNLTAVLPRR